MTRVCAALIAAFLAISAEAQAAPKVAIFPFEMIDVSLDGQYSGTRADEVQRLALATDELRRLAREAGFEVLDLDTHAAEIARTAPFHKCEACEVAIARQIGAESAITGAVRKISNLVLVIHIYVRDLASSKVTKAHRVELRGNTDEAWLRGIRRLARDLANDPVVAK
jgi:hypothetical protein